MAIASQMSGTSKVERLAAQFDDPFRLLALLSALVSLVVPVTAWGDLYKWTDAKGVTVYSDVLPNKSEVVNNFEVMVKSDPPETKAKAQAVPPADRALLSRIEMLERQLQAQQYAAPPLSVAPPTAYSGYYPSSSEPPPMAGYYPSYYPSYSYPFLSSYSYVYPARIYVSRPVFAVSRGGSFHVGGGHVVGGRGGRR